MSITRNILNDTAITKDFHERILTIDNTNDIAEINKLPVANEHGYLDRSWLQDYSSYKIKELGELTTDYTTQIEDTEFIHVVTVKSTGLKIQLTGGFKDVNATINRALVYRFLVYNPDNYSIDWISDKEPTNIIWNTYSETAPTLDANGTYLEFISTDSGETWYGVATDMDINYDIVHNYYTKAESDNRFVNVTGDTMTGTLTIEGSHDSSVSRGLIIKGDNQSHAFMVQDTSFNKGTAPDSYKTVEGVTTFANNGQLGALYSYVTPQNKNSTVLRAHSALNNDSNDNNYIAVSIESDGSKSTYAFTPATNDRSNNIATTEFVGNHFDTYIEHWLVPEMEDTLAGRILSNDGDSSVWVDYKKLQWVYYATANINSVTVPSGYRENAVITDVYRDGVLLTDSDDYSIDTSTGKISFTDTINSGEKIIVVTETAVKAHSHSIFENITINNSNANTPDISDNSSKIATTAYVQSYINSLNIGSGGSGGGDVPTDSPAFTGTPTAPTAPTGTDTNQIATTAFVNNSIDEYFSSASLASDSPSFTGIPTAPTANTGTNTDQIATTRFVNNTVNNIVNNAPNDLNTLKELANAIGNDPNYYLTVQGYLDAKINTGISYVGEGNAVTDITESSGNITVTKDNFSLATHNHDSEYMPLQGTVGDSTKLIYSDDNTLTESDATVGSGVNPVYLDSGSITNSTATIGSDIIPVYLNGGEITAFTTTVGSADTPIYLNNGEIISTGKSFNDYLPLTGGTVTGELIIDGSLSIDDITIDSNEINSENDLVLNSNGNVVKFGNDDSGSVTIENGVVTANTFVGNIGGTSEMAYRDSLGNIIVSTYATIESPNLTGTPTAPTAEPGDNSTKVATTEYVDNAVSTLVNSAPETLDTLAELSTALGDDPNFATTITTQLGNKVDSGSANYVKSVTVNNNDITITTGDNTSSVYTIQDTVYTAGNGINIDGNNEISAISSIPDITDNSGKYLSTDGTSTFWSDMPNEFKISSIHYPNENDTTITLANNQSIPTNINKYAMSVYRDGIYMNAGIDYNFDSETRVLTFIKAFGVDEIVSVIFTYFDSDTQPIIDLDIVEYEAGSNITFAENTSTGKVTISAAQPDLTNYVTNSDLNTALSDYALANHTHTEYATQADINNRFGIAVEKVNELTSSSNITIDPTQGSIFTLTLDTNTTISINSISNGYYTTNGSCVTLMMPSNSYIVSWSSNITWISGSAPDLSTGYNIITFITPNGGTTWYGDALQVES